MSDPLLNRMRETSWRRKLTAGEEAALQAWLAENPEAQADWESETELNETLDRLPSAPVSTNFTARVLQAIERETAAAQPSSPRRWSWHRFLPKTALAVVALVLGLFYYGQYQSAQRAELARNVAVVSELAATTQDPVVWENFEVIRRMGESPGADKDLLKLFQSQ